MSMQGGEYSTERLFGVGRLGFGLGTTTHNLVGITVRQPAAQSNCRRCNFNGAAIERKLVKVLLVFGVNVRQMKGKRPALAEKNELIRFYTTLLPASCAPLPCACLATLTCYAIVTI